MVVRDESRLRCTFMYMTMIIGHGVHLFFFYLGQEVTLSWVFGFPYRRRIDESEEELMDRELMARELMEADTLPLCCLFEHRHIAVLFAPFHATNLRGFH